MIELSSFHGVCGKERSEDAHPITLAHESGCFLSVCDGLGGDGAQEYDFEGFTLSAAYLAANASQEAMKIAFSSELYTQIPVGKRPSFFRSTILEALSVIEGELADQINEASKFSLPTTLCACQISMVDKNSAQIDSYWCGDSRAYFFNERGLFLLTVDDLVSLKGLSREQAAAAIAEAEDLNPMGSEPMSNCIDINRDFGINSAQYYLTEPGLIICCTDGISDLLPGFRLQENLAAFICEYRSLEELTERFAEAVEQNKRDDYSAGISLLNCSYDALSAKVQKEYGKLTVQDQQWNARYVSLITDPEVQGVSADTQVRDQS